VARRALDAAQTEEGDAAQPAAARPVLTRVDTRSVDDAGTLRDPRGYTWRVGCTSGSPFSNQGFENKSLSKHFAWLFALGAIAIAVAVTLALNPVKPGSWKVIFGVIGASAVGLSLVSAWFTQASTGGIIGRFALAGVAVGGVYFAYAHHLMGKAKAAASGAGLSVTGDTGALASLIGSLGGVFVLILVALGGVVGAVIGSRLRAGKGYGIIPARRAA
jgi:hypothetical protein